MWVRECSNHFSLFATLWTVARQVPPVSSVHGILQARILDWIAMPSSRRYFQPRDRTHISCVIGRFLTHWATWEAPCNLVLSNKGASLTAFPNFYNLLPPFTSLHAGSSGGEEEDCSNLSGFGKKKKKSALGCALSHLLTKQDMVHFQPLKRLELNPGPFILLPYSSHVWLFGRTMKQKGGSHTFKKKSLP